MNNRVKNALYSLILLVAILLVWKFRQQKDVAPLKISGRTMGTTYHITYFDSNQRNFQVAVDSLLRLVNKSINTWDSTAEVSVLNRGRAVQVKLPYLIPPLEISKQVHEASGGAYDPTVMPLMNAWGFNQSTDREKPDSARVAALMEYVGFDKLHFDQDSVWKDDPRVQLDFGGIGQGYGADVITDFLKSKGIENMLVELGGEGMAVGRNLQTNKPWELGILDPNSTPDNQFFKAYVSLENRSFTTSGNYFNYRIIDGRKYGHTMNPATGFPVQHDLLSVSVFADDCSSADAWGTALMVMGREKAIATLKEQKNIDALLIYSTEGGLGTFVTDGIKSQVQINP